MSEHEKKIANSHEMFKKTRVTSGSAVFMRNGQAVCKAFNVGAPKPVDLSAKKLTNTTSVAADQFKLRDAQHCGMLKKPL